MSRIRILFLIDKLVAAGTQTNVLEIVKRLDRSKFEPHVIALLGGGELEGEFRSAGIEPVILNVKRAYDFSGLRALRFLIRFMKEKQIDILQTHFLHADILGTIAAKRAGVKTIITTRRDEGFWRSKRQLSLNRFFNRYAKVVLANSAAVREAVKRTEHLSSKQIRVIYNGVDLEKFKAREDIRVKMRKSLGLSGEECAIGMVANMNHLVKGHRYLIKAFSFLKKEVQQAKLFLVGDGQLKGSLERYATHCGITSFVIFLGSRHDIPELLNAMDIICAPSLSEGFSNTILEAMAAGKPVIATNVGGNPEMISYGETGFLVQPQNPEAIAQKLELLAKDPKLAVEIGERARRHVAEEFSIEKMAVDYTEFYASLREDEMAVAGFYDNVVLT